MSEYLSADGVNGYLYRAENERGGLLMLPHSVGIQAEIRREAESLATDGITTLLWDPYPGWDSEAAAAGTNKEPRPPVTDDEAVAQGALCLDYLLGTLGLGAVGLIGYCMGG